MALIRSSRKVEDHERRNGVKKEKDPKWEKRKLGESILTKKE